MATRNVNEGVGSWNNRMPFPKDRYQITCIEEELKSSSGGNPMIVRTWEIASPEKVQIGEREVSIAGQRIMTYGVTKVKAEDGEGWDAEKSDKCFARLVDDLKLLGFDGSEIDDENPPLIARGKTVDAIVYARESQSFKDPTPEQRAQGKKIGDPIKDANGKDVKVYQLAIEQILGLSTVQTDVPY